MKLSKRTLADVSLLVLVNAMWAAQYAAYKTATEKMGPVTVTAWCFLIATLVLLPFLIRWRRPSAPPPGTPNPGDTPEGDPQVPLWRRKGGRSFLLLAIVGLIPASAFLAWGTSRSTASNAALIYLTVPILMALLAVVMLRERMTLVRWVSLAISLCGVLILSDIEWRHLELTQSKFLLGNILVLLACTSSAFYNVYSKRLLRRFTPLEILVAGYVIAFAGSLPLVFLAEGFSLASVLTYDIWTWISLLVLSVLSWGLAMVLWLFLLKRLDVSQVSVSIYLLPFLGVLISTLTLGEKITPTMIVGGALALVGTILVTSLEPSSA